MKTDLPAVRTRRLGLAGELTIAVLAVAVVVGFIFLLLRWYFPEGVELEATGDVNPEIATTNVAVAYVSGNSTDDRPRVGSLAVRRNEVQSRSADELEWRDAAIGTEFRERDSLQTGPRSYATVRSARGMELAIGQRSLVVFSGSAAGLAADYARPITMVMQGELGGHVEAGAEPSEEIVRVNGGALRAAPSSSAALDYTVRVNENSSATISVLRGSAEYVSESQATAIAPRQALTVDERGGRVALVDIPKTPVLVAPADRARIDVRGDSRAVDFTWNEVSGVDGYRIVIARDQALTDRLVDEQVPETRFRHGSLAAGRYFWTVRARAGWAYSEPGAVRELLLATDARPPDLALDATPKVVNVRSVTISGRTDPGARVFVGGRPAETVEGNFRHVTQLDPGANVIVVESVDPTGNVAYASVVVTAK
jgi:hypothetical protein